MNASQKIVTNIPLDEIWNQTEVLPAIRVQVLEREQVRQLVQSRFIRFVVADVGHPLCWVPQSESYSFWKLKARPHIVEFPNKPFDIYAFSEGYAYIASQWCINDLSALKIVLLEKYH